MTALYHARAKQVPLAASIAIECANLKKMLDETGVSARPETVEALISARRDIETLLGDE